MFAISQSKTFDPRSPRTYTATVEKDQTINKAVRRHRFPKPNRLSIIITTKFSQKKGRIIRAEGAHQNGLENLGFFATAVLAGNLAGLSASTLNALSGSYVLSRSVYNLIYINNTSEIIAHMRSAVYFFGIWQVLTLFIKSGNVLRERTANLL